MLNFMLDYETKEVLVENTFYDCNGRSAKTVLMEICKDFPELTDTQFDLIYKFIKEV